MQVFIIKADLDNCQQSLPLALAQRARVLCGYSLSKSVQISKQINYLHLEMNVDVASAIRYLVIMWTVLFIQAAPKAHILYTMLHYKSRMRVSTIFCAVLMHEQKQQQYKIMRNEAVLLVDNIR